MMLNTDAMLNFNVLKYVEKHFIHLKNILEKRRKLECKLTWFSIFSFLPVSVIGSVPNIYFKYIEPSRGGGCSQSRLEFKGFLASNLLFYGNPFKFQLTSNVSNQICTLLRGFENVNIWYVCLSVFYSRGI